MNAAPDDRSIYETILEQHRAIKELLGQIDALLQDPSCNIAEAEGLMKHFGEELVEHFRLEESECSLADAFAHAPQLLRRANALMEEHPRIAQWAQSLTRAIDKADPQQWRAEARRRFAAVHRDLLTHERSEDALLQEAYTRDIEAAD